MLDVKTKTTTTISADTKKPRNRKTKSKRVPVVLVLMILWAGFFYAVSGPGGISHQRAFSYTIFGWLAILLAGYFV